MPPTPNNPLEMASIASALSGMGLEPGPDRKTKPLPPPPKPEDWILENAQAIAREYYRRNFNSGLNLYRALPGALPFHRSKAFERLIYGSNQAGKTGAALAEVTRILEGTHPLFRKTNGIMLCVGLDGDHIGQNMWHKLTSPTLFQTVPDELTGARRAVRPNPLDPRHLDPIDLARQDQWEWAPPLLPPEQWDYKGGIVWEDKGKNVPRVVNIRSNGWKMLWHPSGGKERRGIEIDFAWFDEEIERKTWYFETVPRLLRRNGRFLWSATPQTEEYLLLNLHQRVMAGEPGIEEFQLQLDDNPYIPDEAKKLMHAKFSSMSADDLAVRYYGQFAALKKKIYGGWDMSRLSQGA